MKRLFLLAICAMALAAGCQKQETEEFPTFYASAEVSGGAKTALVGSSIHWEDGDLVKVYGDCGYAQYRVTPEPDPTCAMMSYNNVTSGNWFGFLPYRIVYPYALALDGSGNNTTLRVQLPNRQQSTSGELTRNFPMYAESMLHNVYFKNLCGVMCIHLTHPTKRIDSIVVSANETLYGKYTIDNSGDAPSLVNPTDGGSTVTLQLASAQSIAGGKDFYICLPVGTYTGLTLSIYADDNSFCTKSGSSSFTIYRSQVSPITIPSSALTFRTSYGSLIGQFSVSRTKKVLFSQGNLQYQASTGTWRFAEHQWDIIGEANSNISSTYDGWIDLFGWGTSGYHNSADPYNTNYMPYSTSETRVSWNLNYFGYGPSINMADTNLTGSSANYDWGVYNAISNGGNHAGLWRTLTKNEWSYLFYTRSASTVNGTANARYCKAQVNGVNGVVIFPDSYTHPDGVAQPTSINTPGASFTTNSYTETQWSSMEDAGAVFLPAGGFRSQTTVINIDEEDGRYWSASAFLDGNAYCVFFYDRGLRMDYVTRSSGLSVRLVQDDNR